MQDCDQSLFYFAAFPNRRAAQMDDFSYIYSYLHVALQFIR